MAPAARPRLIGRSRVVLHDGRMTNSFYLGPLKPRFSPSEWSDIVSAAADGILDESHWVELKKALPPKSAGANTEVARDLASLSVDGGVLVVGIEDDRGKTGAVTGTDIAGLVSRLDAVARATVAPPLTITSQVFQHPADPDLAVLLVTVPASAAAPHMVDSKYWGRGDEGKRALSDIEVRRLLAFRQERSHGFETRLKSIEDAIGAEPHRSDAPYFRILAEPSTQPSGTDASTALNGLHPLAFFTEAVSERLKFAPSLHSLNYVVPHPDGVAAKSFGKEDVEDGDRLSVLIGDDGAWRVLSGSPVQPLGASGDPTSGNPVFRAVAFLELTHALLTSIAHLSTKYVPLNVEWHIGIHLTGLRGVYPVEQHIPKYFPDFSPYPRDAYLRTTTTTTEEISNAASAVVDRLTRPLLRSLSIDSFYLPYKNLADIGRR